MLDGVSSCLSNGASGTSIAVVLLGAVVFDLLMGEVPNRVHPVVGMGTLTRALLRAAPRRALPQLLFGAAIVVVVVSVSGLSAWFALRALRAVREAWGGSIGATVVALGVEALLLSTLFAGRALIAAGSRMRAALATSLDEGRAALSHLCSRDPSALERDDLCGATVESLTENASDSFIAPLFWYCVVGALGGPGLVAAACYRATNTLDAMIGYRGKYEYLGKCAARLDDGLNWVPARLTALLLVFCAPLTGGRAVDGWIVAQRDHALTESPNAGWPMAAAAGILSAQLSKPGAYVLGRGLPLPNVTTITRAQRLVAGALTVFTAAASALLVGVGGE